MSIGRPAASLGLLLVLGAVAPAAPQERKPQVFGVDVRLVAVPVFVTDKSAQSVSGLTAADFEIEEQGRKLPVAGFLAVDAGAATAEVPAGISPALVAASRRQFVLLFDQSFSTSSTLLKARQGALKMLAETLQPGDLVAVAGVGPGGVRVLTNLTSDRAQAAQAVATFGAADGSRLRDPLGLAYDMAMPLNVDIGSYGVQIGGANAPEMKDALLQRARAERDAYRQSVLAYVDALEGLGKLLDSIQGRKQVVLFSAGFDQSVLLGATGSEQAENAASVATGRIWEVQSDRHFGDAQTRDRMGRLFEVLTRSDTVLHTVYLSEPSAGASLTEQGNVPTGSGRETLAELAGRSGGRFVREPADMASALREVLGATRYYYVIAFEPADVKKKPGDLRKIKIRVKRPGLEVSHRAGYTLPDATATVAAQRQLSAAEVIAKGLSGGAFRLSALAVPYLVAGGDALLPVVLEIDGEGLLDGAGKEPLPLEIYGYAFDGQGHVVDAVGLTPTLDLQAMTPVLRSKGVQVLTTFRVPPGAVDLRFLVREGRQGRAASLRLTTSVPDGSGDPRLSPPLLMDDPRTRVVIPTASRRNPQLQIPFRVEDTAFTPAALGALRAGEPQEVCLMAFGMTPGAGARIEAELLGGANGPVALEAGPARVVSDADGVTRVVFTLTPRSLAAGEYRLRARLVDGEKTASSAELPVVVR